MGIGQGLDGKAEPSIAQHQPTEASQHSNLLADSLAIRQLVFDEALYCRFLNCFAAVKDNWKSHESFTLL